jgi:hypothetical protein
MIKAAPKYVISVVMIALLLTLGGSLARASEITGSLSTDGTNQNQNPSPTPTLTPTPSNDSGHISENDNGSLSGEVIGGSGTSNTNTEQPVQYNMWERAQRDAANAAANQNSNSSTETTNATPTISDEEAAHVALSQFGPRYGLSDYTPGAPDAGSGGNLSVGSGSGGSQSTDYEAGLFPEDTESPFAYVAEPGAGPVLPGENQVAAGILSDAAGLSFTQLALIALIALILLASMGYAISKTSQTSRMA